MRTTTSATATLSTCPASDRAAFAGYTAILDRVLANKQDQSVILGADPALAADPSARLTFVAIDSKRAGCVATWLDPGRAHGWLGSIAVLPAHRGHGLGRDLAHAAVEDRAAHDGQPLPLFATVRRLPDGGLNLPSWRALHAAGFVACGRLRPRIAEIGPRGAALWASAEQDGSIRQVLLARVVSFDPEADG